MLSMSEQYSISFSVMHENFAHVCDSNQECFRTLSRRRGWPDVRPEGSGMLNRSNSQIVLDMACQQRRTGHVTSYKDTNISNPFQTFDHNTTVIPARPLWNCS